MVPVVEVVVVVEPVFIVGMTAADSFSFSRSVLSSDQYLVTGKRTVGNCKCECTDKDVHIYDE